MSYKCNPGVLPKSEVVEALLPCPFCGGPACIVYDSGNEVMNQKWCVGCAKCGMQAIERGSNSWSQGAAAKREDAAAKARAIRIWNRRALTAPAAQGEEKDAIRWRFLLSCSAAERRWLLHNDDPEMTTEWVDGRMAEIEAAEDHYDNVAGTIGDEQRRHP